VGEESLRDRPRQGHVAPPGAALQPLAPALVELFANLDPRTLAKVEVLPAQPCDAEELEEQLPVGVDRGEQRPQLLASERFGVVVYAVLIGAPSGDADAPHRVRAQEPVVHGGREHRRQRRPQLADRRRGKP